MSTAVEHLLAAFDALPAAERKEAAIEILRRTADDSGDPSDDMLTGVADELFCRLDAEEASRAAG